MDNMEEARAVHAERARAKALGLIAPKALQWECEADKIACTLVGVEAVLSLLEYYRDLLARLGVPTAEIDARISALDK